MGVADQVMIIWRGTQIKGRVMVSRRRILIKDRVMVSRKRIQSEEGVHGWEDVTYLGRTGDQAFSYKR